MKKMFRLFSIVTLSIVLSLITFKGIESVKAFTTPTSLESEVMVDTGNGFGSTNTKYRRFANIDVNVGSDITYADSSTDGASFTINHDGLYAISYTDYRFDQGDAAGITINNGSISSLSTTESNVLCLFSPNPTNVHNCSVVVLLSSTDVVRANFSIAGFGPGQSGDSTVRFVITKIR
jgi:hypothetical protein